MQHPVTTEYKNTKKNILQTIKAVHLLKKPTVWFWPNIDAGNDVISKEIRKFREKYNPKNILFVKNFSPENFLNIIIKSSCIIGNSSVAIRECSFLGIPAVNIGTRQNGREHGENVKHVNYNFKKIITAVEYQIRKKRYKSSKMFGDGNAGKKIVKILEKYKFLNLQKKLAIK
jgi:UDP-N-acetylglucosamine 2-epimerase